MKNMDKIGLQNKIIISLNIEKRYFNELKKLLNINNMKKK